MTDEELAALASQGSRGGRSCWICEHAGARALIQEMLDWNERNPYQPISRDTMHGVLVKQCGYPFTRHALSKHVREHRR